MIRRETVVLDLDTTEFAAGMARAARAVKDLRASLRSVGRAARGAFDTTGDRHIERIMRDCAARRLPVDVTARRLMVASDIAQVLDGRWQR